MKILVVILFVFLSTIVCGQTVQHSTQNRTARIKEKYSVLKSDTVIKEGRYELRTLFDDQLICEGFYKNNLKDSIWKYFSNGGFLLNTGSYVQGKKVGVWVATREDTRALSKYDYTSKTLLYVRPNPQDSAKLFNVIDGNKELTTKLDRAPLPLDGERLLYSSIARYISVPEHYRLSGVKSKRVIVVFKIDKSGEVVDYHVKEKVGYGLDESAIECVKASNGEWLPGILNGQPVSVLYEIPITYELGN